MLYFRMSVILEDSNDSQFVISNWGWGVLYNVICNYDIVRDQDHLARLERGAMGGTLGKDERDEFIKVLKKDILPNISSEESLLLDMSVKGNVDKKTFFKGEESHKNYFVSREKLIAFIEFLKHSSPPITVY